MKGQNSILATKGLLRLCSRTVILVLVILYSIVSPVLSMGNTERKYLLATANTAGTYYPVGVALATLTKVKLEPDHGLSLTAISSAGSAENLQKLAAGEVQFSILQGLYGYWAWNGKGPFADTGPQHHLRSITMLWKNVEHFAVQSDYVRTGTMADLQGLVGKSFAIGEENSGSAGSGLFILQSLGFDPEREFELNHLSYGESARAMRKGNIQLMNTPGGPPVAAVDRVFAALGKDVTILNFSIEQMQQVNSTHPLWSVYIIEPNTYPGQETPVITIGQPNFFVVHEDVPEEDVYLILSTMYANLDFLHNIHPITRAMKIPDAIDGLPIPLHPGAARFFREQGVEIPDHLLRRW